VKVFLAYTAARLGIFLLAYGLVLGSYLLFDHEGPVPVLWPLLVAAVISAVVSVYALGGLRARFSSSVNERAERMSRRFEEMKAKEDVD
jgi:CHASE2 domain-containing sensor protein